MDNKVSSNSAQPPFTATKVMEPIKLTLSPEGPRLTVDRGLDQEDSGLRRLTCTLTPSETTPSVEGALTWLISEATGIVLAEKQFNAGGNVAFVRIPTGLYSLWVRLAHRAYLVTGIELL